MYRDFGLIGIQTSLLEKKVTLEFTLDIHPKSATADALVLCEKESGKIVSADIHVSKNIVTLQMKDWPMPESEYLLRIQGKQIKSIINDELPDSILRTLQFRSEVVSTITIISPSEQEEIPALKLKWEEHVVPADRGLVLSYYLEIAKENAFHNVLIETTVNEKNEIELTEIPPGQYYVRIRAQKGEQFGRWSETVTFHVVPEKQPVIEDEDDIYERKLKCIEMPLQGETPETFKFVFDEEIDIENLPIIKITRRMI